MYTYTVILSRLVPVASSAAAILSILKNLKTPKLSDKQKVDTSPSPNGKYTVEVKEPMNQRLSA